MDSTLLTDPTASSFRSTQSDPSSSFSQLDTSSLFCQGKFSEDYLNIDDIQSLSQRTTCVFREAVHGLGFIDPSSESPDIVPGTKIEAPLWLAKIFNARKLVTVELPKGYNETYREILDAGATAVDLHKLGPNFYKFGKHLVEMNLKESDEVAKSLVNSFHSRFHKLLDFSLSAASDTVLETMQYQSTLDNLELDILTTGRKSAEDFKKWENRSSEKVTANAMVTKMKKRKQAGLQDLDIGNSQRSNNNKKTTTTTTSQ